MPHRDSSELGTPCWIDLMSSEPDLVTPFYTGLFGWSSERSGEGSEDYVMFYLNGQPVAGMGANTADSGFPDTWVLYIAVESAETAAAAAKQAGGKVLVEPTTVGPEGRFAIIADPDGATLGVWEADQQDGFGVIAEPGAPVWFELNTRDFDTVRTFYATVFGWQYEPLNNEDGNFRYETVVVNGEQVCGLFDASDTLPEGVPSHWHSYLGTPDTDQTLQQAAELGGEILQEPFDTEYGRIARFSDPTGASVTVCSIPTPDDEESPG
ncbi:VOC family protein [Hoyosella subflava]|uniref:Glyoxalase/bleomycin resistance protein/dioxygenase n=1 Tax=Hoyosella subflava (strain DSM 45089 / JCM 17490 / NBRC 109087 / DQS3-9A1) TaxID=443218 RepID=F6EJB6_HOYSD|nr:VOC family protein [Hoyosella subflava]AEF42532.1 Glyoxalase/bleomycin resistance protein/dioxygenase [Hoyosella subflava DQS3-9A1]